MKEMSHDRRRSPFRSIYHLVRNGLPLEPETALYILMSTADVFMTWYLLYNGASNDRTWFVESNPIPRYFLESWGFDGLVYFKFSLVAFVAVICQVIARTRLDVARRVLNLATLLVTGVVIYSVALMVQHG